MLARKLDAVRSSLVHFPKAFADARHRRAELAPFATPLDVVAALEPAAGRSAAQRYAVVAALVAEHHRVGAGRASALWASLLLVAFQPMLLRLRTRMGRPEGGSAFRSASRAASARRAGLSSPRDEERDARVLAAFLEALAAARDVGPYAAVALQRGTQRALAAQRAADRKSAQDDAFDEDLHTPCTPRALTLGDACVDAAWAEAHEQKLAALSPRAPRAPHPARPEAHRSAA